MFQTLSAATVAGSRLRRVASGILERTIEGVRTQTYLCMRAQAKISLDFPFFSFLVFVKLSTFVPSPVDTWMVSSRKVNDQWISELLVGGVSHTEIYRTPAKEIKNS